MDNKFRFIIDNKSFSQSLGPLIKCARKDALKQVEDISSLLKVDVSIISGWENGNIVPSLLEWKSFCNITRIDTDSFEHKFIDTFSFEGLWGKSRKEYQLEYFNIPSKYLDNKTVSVRWLAPFLSYTAYRLGPDKLCQLLKYLKVDEDYFVNYQHQVNIRFIFDLFDATKRHFDLSCFINEGSQYGSQKIAHGSLWNCYSITSETYQDLYCRLIKNFNRYDDSFKYEIVDYADNNHLYISFEPKDFVLDLEKESRDYTDYLEILTKYRCQWLSSFSKINNSLLFPVQVNQIECNKKGTGDCLYEVAI